MAHAWMWYVALGVGGWFAAGLATYRLWLWRLPPEWCVEGERIKHCSNSYRFERPTGWYVRGWCEGVDPFWTLEGAAVISCLAWPAPVILVGLRTSIEAGLAVCVQGARLVTPKQYKIQAPIRDDAHLLAEREVDRIAP